MDELVRKIVESWGLDQVSKTGQNIIGPKTEMQVLGLVIDIFVKGVQLVGIERVATSEVKEHSDNPCLYCRASGHWPGHEEELWCFHDAVFLGKSANPKPIDKARKECPRAGKNG